MLGKKKRCTRDLTNIAPMWTCVYMFGHVYMYLSFCFLVLCHLLKLCSQTERAVLDHEGVFGVRCIAQ